MKHGFTLVELMIVVAIIGILAATAVPVYNAYIDDASRTEAHVNLADIAQKENAYYRTWDEYLCTNEATDDKDAWKHDKESAYQRSIQPMTENGDWVKLGYRFRTPEEGGLFGGPVYFKYTAISQNDEADPAFAVCAHRWLGEDDEDQEQIFISSRNLRTFITKADERQDCVIPPPPESGE